MAPAIQRRMAAREEERFPTEWAMCEATGMGASRHRGNRRLLGPEAGRRCRQRRLGAQPAR